MSVDGFVSALTGELREQPLPEFIKRALAARVVLCGRKPEHYEARRDAVHRQIGEDAFRTLKRDYYAGRMAVIERHFEVEFYSQEVSAQTGRMAPPLTPVAKFLDDARVANSLDSAAWTGAGTTTCVGRRIEGASRSVDSRPHIRSVRRAGDAA